MSKIINTVFIIVILVAIALIFGYHAINYTIDAIDYRNVKTVTLEQIESGEVKKRFIRLEKVMAYYLYSIKGYNSFSSADKPSALYYPVVNPDDFNKNTLTPDTRFKVLVRDEDYNSEVINQREEVILSEEISFNGKILNEIPASIRKEITSSVDFKEHFAEKLIYIEKDYKPMPIVFTGIFYLLALASIALIFIILNKGGIEVIRISRYNVKTKNIKDNLGEL
jgi:hypothetical protein